MIPLAASLGFLTEQLSLHTNQTLAGFLNATFGPRLSVLAVRAQSVAFGTAVWMMWVCL